MTEDTREADGRTLREMSHTNPYTDESFGATQTYARGQFVAADGGEARAVPDEAAERDDRDRADEAAADVESAVEPVGDAADDETRGGRERPADGDAGAGETLREIDHTPPRNAPSANPAYMADDENDER